jgi:undecaprenyl-diphosphatase
MDKMNSWVVGIVLGIVEGLTEFVPVSSTGHLIIAGHLMGFVGEKAASFEVAIQLGAILAVVVLYWRRFLALIPTGAKHVSLNDSTLTGWSGIWRIAVAILPALIVGYGARYLIKGYLFTPSTVTWALALGGVAILLAERALRGRPIRPLDALTSSQALGIGLFQVLSLWPGTSRAAATIVGGMVVGLDRKGAAEFSFLIAVPVMVAATGSELLSMRDHFPAMTWLSSRLALWYRLSSRYSPSGVLFVYWEGGAWLPLPGTVSLSPRYSTGSPKASRWHDSYLGLTLG